ncbi:Helix-turn-helix domain-containing protein [Vibrio chagasii]|uniref:winged helix-turn-helix domain-containing protein n=1 Tax=Vibrio TaxID=662 RepID=UPI000E326843|nr:MULTISPECIES: helix-turn-helix domain-containing protein [Vibrio]CAH6940021.1 Helix-turn-helix domain-containing protein [Vibrio chagasii]CAH6953113.1 Helix-turn-helix domain-containing protein [Vibrio chagasii]CAH6990985.1 Helix-turn-helix domain-containing protein [Vibrio chagasii]CAH7004902.1 Helix-turn-helix domain-containing protein [Vibrio chagasii]CAH7159152.1 Helix-turn-helix domain-containing protein [Vibrio chagasii]
MKFITHRGALRLTLLKNAKRTSVRLTFSEFLIIEEMLGNQGEHLTKQHLLNIGWPNSCVCDNALNMTIMSLRKKLLKLGEGGEIITIHRIGYAFIYSNDKNDESHT